MIGIKRSTICVGISCFHAAQLGNGIQVSNGNAQQNNTNKVELLDFGYSNHTLEEKRGSSTPYTSTSSLLDHGAHTEGAIHYLPHPTSVLASLINTKIGFRNSRSTMKMVLKASLISIVALAVLFRLYQCFFVLTQKRTISSRRLARDEECKPKPEPKPESQPPPQRPPTVMQRLRRRLRRAARRAQQGHQTAGAPDVDHDPDAEAEAAAEATFDAFAASLNPPEPEPETVAAPEPETVPEPTDYLELAAAAAQYAEAVLDAAAAPAAEGAAEADQAAADDK